MTWMNDLIIPVSFRPKRKIGSFEATITLEENATDDLEITQHPVQDGATITDHAYIKPVKLSIRAQYSPLLLGVPVDEMYRRLRVLQASRIPMDVVTGKRIYRNMLISSLSETTDRETSTILNVSATLQEVILPSVVTVPVPATTADRSKQEDPGRTGSTENGGIKKAQELPASEQPKRQSALRSLAGG